MNFLLRVCIGFIITVALEIIAIWYFVFKD